MKKTIDNCGLLLMITVEGKITIKVRISDTKGKIGSSEKLKLETNWEAKINIESMIHSMVEKDLERRLNGK